jgi:hypothetical protein
MCWLKELMSKKTVSRKEKTAREERGKKKIK